MGDSGLTKISEIFEYLPSLKFISLGLEKNSIGEEGVSDIYIFIELNINKIFGSPEILEENEIEFANQSYWLIWNTQFQ